MWLREEEKTDKRAERGTAPGKKKQTDCYQRKEAETWLYMPFVPLFVSFLLRKNTHTNTKGVIIDAFLSLSFLHAAHSSIHAVGLSSAILHNTTLLGGENVN